MKICLISDLHFEINGWALKTRDFKKADVLIVAGDLTCARFFNPERNDTEAKEERKLLERFKKSVASKFDRVFYVVGNHEYYGAIWGNVIPWLENALEGSNIELLVDEFKIHNGVYFYGTTLWTSFNNGDPVEMMKCGQFMNDYNLIFRKDPMHLTYEERHHPNYDMRTARITPRFILSEHMVSQTKIDLFLEKHQDKPVVMITHHAPSLSCQNRQRFGDSMMHAYCSDLDHMMEAYPNIKLWVYGHSHESKDDMIYDTRVVSNQMGYWGRDPGAYDFKPLYIDV